MADPQADPGNIFTKIYALGRLLPPERGEEHQTRQPDEDARERIDAMRFHEAQAAVSAADAAFKAEHPDYDEVLDRVEMIETEATKGWREGTSLIQQLLALEPRRAAILYYLGHHPEEAARFMQAPTTAALFDIFLELIQECSDRQAAFIKRIH